MADEGGDIPTGGAVNNGQAGSSSGGGGGGGGGVMITFTPQVELAMVLISFGVQLLYFAYRNIRARIGPSRKVNSWDESSTWFRLGKQARSAWMDVMLHDNSTGILAVQTLRNVMMPAILCATTAAFLAQTVIFVVLDQSKMQLLDNATGSSLPISSSSKLVICLGLLFLSFFCFLQCLRFATHCCFLIPAACKKDGRDSLSVSSASSEALVVGTQFYFAVGLRVFYAFVPVVMWAVAGVIPLLVGSCALVMLDYVMDSAHGVELGFEPGRGLTLSVQNYGVLDEERAALVRESEPLRPPASNAGSVSNSGRASESRVHLTVSSSSAAAAPAAAAARLRGVQLGGRVLTADEQAD